MRLEGVPDDVNVLTASIIGAAIEVHKTLGPGLTERVYHEALAHVLRERGHVVTNEVPIPVVYDGVDLGIGYRADLEVDEKVLVEVKSVQDLADVHRAQLWTYLKLRKRAVGLLINFNVQYLRDGVKRVAGP